MAKRFLEKDGTPVDIQVQPKKENKTTLTPRDITSADNSASVQALVFSLSKAKPRSTFFDGELTDGIKLIRVVGFDKNQHAKLMEFYTKNVPVILGNCQIQLNKIYSKLEVVIHSYTNIRSCDVKFTIPDPKTFGSDTIDLILLAQKNEYDRVTVRAQVTKISDPAKVGKGLTKQEVTIADRTEAALLTLWEGDVGTLDIGLSYQFNRLTVRTYRGNRQLSLPATGASVDLIDDIGDVAEDSFDLDNDTALQAAQVMGVSALEYIYTCMQCKRGTVKPSGNNLGTCEQCHTMQRLNTRKQTCKLFIQAREQPHITLRAYEEMLQAICTCDTNNITCENIISAPIFDLKYNEYHVITNVSRPGQQ